jgi:hypothetical protein
MRDFRHTYCSWLEELAEAQKTCESVTMRILDLETAGKPVSPELTGSYLRAHRTLKSVADRFPSGQERSNG